MSRLGPVALVVLLAGLALTRGGPATTAQGGEGARVVALETKVADLTQRVHLAELNLSDVYVRALPEPDPNGQWVGATYVYDQATYGFNLVCRIGQLGGQYGTQYSLHCTRTPLSSP